MPSGPSISIALCTYNGAAHIGAQLESLASQSTLPSEVVVSDDASDDETLAIVESFARRVPFTVHIHRNGTTHGYTRNFEMAIGRCSGELIFMCDQDDVWHREKLTRFVACFKGTPSPGIVFCDANLVDQNLGQLGRTWWQARRFVPRKQRQLLRPDGWELILRDPTQFAAGATMAFRSQYTPMLLPFPTDWTYDAWIATVVSMVAPIGIVPEPLNDYRQHATQVFGGSDGQQVVRSNARTRGASSAHFTETANRYAALQERVGSLGSMTRDGVADRVSDKIRHWSARADMRRVTPYRRLELIARESIQGNYHHYSQGWRSAALDVFA